MGIPELRALARSSAFSILGVPATVTIPGGEPVATRVIWLTPMQDGVPVAVSNLRDSSFQRADPRRSMAIRRDDVPAVPLGTIISVTEHNLETPTAWRVDSMLLVETEQHRVSVLPHAEES